MSDDEQATKTSSSPEFITLEEAAAMTTGTRVTFIPGIPALYSEALKNICFVKGIPLIRALHPMLGIDKATGEDQQAKLYELTSQTGLPTMFHNEERPRNVWTEQLALAEQIGAPGSPSLLPSDFELRAGVFGLSAVILAEDGFIWNMRILGDSPLARKYGFSEEASSAALGKMVEVIALIARRLASQEQQGSRYLVGDSLSAADIYWATLSMSVLVPAPEIMPLTRQNKGMLKYFEKNSQNPVIADALSDKIRDHQQYVLTTYCETPAVLGGDLL
jgi:glutathione S-transferase